MRFIVILLFVLSALSNFASTVNGVAKDYIGESIRLVFYTDLFSQQPILVGETTVASDGSFTFDCHLNAPLLYFDRIAMKC